LDESLRKVEKLRALLDVGRAFAQELSPEALLQLVVDKTSDILDADRATLLLLDRERGELWSRVAEDLEIDEIRFPMHLGLEGCVASTGEILNVPDAYEDPRAYLEIDRLTGFRTRSILCAPVKDGDGTIIGVLEAINKKDGDFAKEDEEYIAILAAQVAAALKNAELFEELCVLKNYNESILRSMGTAVISVDPEGVIRTLNPAAVRLFDLQEMGWCALSLIQLLEDGKNQLLADAVGRAVLRGEEYTGYNLRYTSMRGRQLDLNIRVMPLFDDEGECHGSVLVADDISKEQRLVNSFCRYMEREVVDRVLKDIDAPRLGGTRQSVTILFSDIRGYSSMSERMTAEEVAAMLNEYFSRMVKQIFRYEGMLDKYIGDAIMAVFGAPIGREDDALRAVQAAVAMRRELSCYNDEREAAGRPPIEIGIGLSSGEALCGNIGSIDRLDYTVIGDVVNVASRLEGLTKDYRCKILISDGVYEAVRTRIPCIELGLEQVKGRTEPVRVYGIDEEWIRASTAQLSPGALI
jgi:adenylate cyclase